MVAEYVLKCQIRLGRTNVEKIRREKSLGNLEFRSIGKGISRNTKWFQSFERSLIYRFG